MVGHHGLVVGHHAPVVRQPGPVVRETRKKLEHDREHDIGLIVDVVTSTAQRTGDTALLAAFEQTIHYKRQIAAKGVQTRRKNESAEDVVDAPSDGENA